MASTEQQVQIEKKERQENSRAGKTDQLGEPPSLVLIAQDSISSYEATDSPASTTRTPAEMANLEKPDDELTTTTITEIPIVGLQRQLTMGGYEQAAAGEEKFVEPAPMLQRQDTLISDEDFKAGFGNDEETARSPTVETKKSPATASSSSKKRMAADLQPETLLKRQETLAEDGKVPAEEADWTSVPMRRANSLLEEGEEEETVQKPLRIRSSAFTKRADIRDSPTLFSPPSVVESTDLLFVKVPEGTDIVRNTMSPISPGPFSPMTLQQYTSGENTTRAPPVGITRQESWKEDVSDAGWRAW